MAWPLTLIKSAVYVCHDCLERTGFDRWTSLFVRVASDPLPIEERLRTRLKWIDWERQDTRLDSCRIYVSFDCQVLAVTRPGPNVTA